MASATGFCNPRRQRRPERNLLRGARTRIGAEVNDGAASRAAGQFRAALGNERAATFGKGGRHPLMHRTETIDYAIVLSGEITMVMDDRDVELKAGDVLVQCGTNHAWSNRSNAPCVVAFVLIDGEFDPALKERFD